MSVTAAMGADRPGEHGEDVTAPALKSPAVVADPEVPGWGEAGGGARNSAPADRLGSGRGFDAEATSTVVRKERIVIDVDMLQRESSDGARTARDRQSSRASIAKLLCRLWLGRWASGSVASLVVALTVAFSILVLMRITSGTHDGRISALIAVLTAQSLHYGVMTIIAAVAVTTVLVLGSSPHFRFVAAYIFFIWLQMACRTAAHGLAVNWISFYFLYVAYAGLWAVVTFLGCVVVKLRIDALQACAHAESHRLKVRRISCSKISLLVFSASALLYGFSWVLCFWFGSCAIEPGHVNVWQLPLFVTLSIGACSYWTFAGISCHVFFRAWRVAAGVAAVARERLKDDARQAQRTAFFQLLGTIMTFLSSTIFVGAFIATRVLFLQRHIPFFNGVSALEDTLALFDALANMLLVLSLAGVFSGSLVASFVKESLEIQRRYLHTSTVARMTLSENPEWNSTLEQLAGRGFTLQALLEFYRGLGNDYMLHYDSERHTTRDVARQAIIPLSSDKRVAYASIMMSGVPTRPENMVTHAWGNLFRDLTAAIISDALSESEYAMVAYLLEHDIDRLERWIYAIGKQSSTYWVCAFSVNQHATICGENYNNSRDSVTGELHPTCCCSHTKILNETAPCFNGKSINCEVNKFDDFMMFMSASSPSFKHVVAVDANFTLFSRAWCVAELAVAAKMGMTQKVKVHSRDRLERCSDQLRCLRIEAMHASREEDKAEILRKIPDKERFNKELRSLLVERLFPSWHSLDPTDQLVRMSSLGRWYSVSQSASLDGIWAVCSSQTLGSP